MRARNWGRVIGLSSKIPLSLNELERLQDIVIGSKKLRNMAIRKKKALLGSMIEKPLRQYLIIYLPEQMTCLS